MKNDFAESPLFFMSCDFEHFRTMDSSDLQGPNVDKNMVQENPAWEILAICQSQYKTEKDELVLGCLTLVTLRGIVIKECFVEPPPFLQTVSILLWSSIIIRIRYHTNASSFFSL